MAALKVLRGVLQKRRQTTLICRQLRILPLTVPGGEPPAMLEGSQLQVSYVRAPPPVSLRRGQASLSDHVNGC